MTDEQKTEETQGEAISDRKTPIGCPFAQPESSQIIRREDLVNLGNAFKSSLSPVGGLVDHVKQQNDNSVLLLEGMKSQARHADRLQRWVLYLTLVISVGILIHLGSLYRLTQVSKQVDSTAKKLESVSTAVVSVKKSAEATQAGVEEVSQAQSEASRVELIPELDPMKAKEAPLRVRVVTPARRRIALKVVDGDASVAAAKSVAMPSEPAPPTPAVTAEIPIPLERLQ